MRLAAVGAAGARPGCVGWLARSPGAPGSRRDSARWALAIPDGYTLSAAEFPQLALSSDGHQQVAVVVGADGMPRLLLRSIEEFEPRLLPDSERANSPVFSPDGRWIAFCRDTGLYKVATSGGAPIRLSETTVQTRGLTWSSDGFLYFAPDTVSGIFRVPEGGGVVTQVTTPDGARDERTHRWPSALPDGSAVIFTNDSQASTEFYDDARIEAVRLATGERKLLVEGASSARWSPGGRLVFARGGALYAVELDAASLDGPRPAAARRPGGRDRHRVGRRPIRHLGLRRRALGAGRSDGLVPARLDEPRRRRDAGPRCRPRHTTRPSSHPTGSGSR